jgi:hypothetical protein
MSIKCLIYYRLLTLQVTIQNVFVVFDTGKKISIIGILVLLTFHLLSKLTLVVHLQKIWIYYLVIHESQVRGPIAGI